MELLKLEKRGEKKLICDNEVAENWRRKKIVVMEMLKIGGERGK